MEIRKWDFTLEVDKAGKGVWTPLKSVKVGAKSAERIVFAVGDTGEWIRLKAKGTNQRVSSFFLFGQ